jgi:predicted small metal-binding protein
MSAARNGRRFMHFSNCAGTLDDIHLTQAITNERITARRLGSNEASSDLSVPNTMEFSISGNIGLNYSEDIDERSRQIFLAYFEEEANGGKFKNPFLHRTVREQRGGVLSAIAALFREWELQGMPKGEGVFTTYPQWAETVGGVMGANDLGDPCLPFKDDTFNVRGDQKTEAMTAIYEVCHNDHGETWIRKDDLYSTIHKAVQDTEDNSGVEALGYFCPIKEHEKAQDNRKRLGYALTEYNLRILDGIRMEIDKSSANRGRHRYRFTKLRENGPDIITSENSSDKPENAPETPENPVTMSQRSHVAALMRDENFSELKKSRSSDNSKERALLTDPLTRDNCDIVTRDAGIALDIETYSSDPKSRDALDAFKGKIRLVSIASSEGIQTFDLKKAPLSRETLEAIRSNDLIIHNASFELRWFGRHFGFIPKNVFCTLTADRLLIPSKKIKHDLKTVLDRRMGVEISKDIDQKAWGADVVTQAQLDYAHRRRGHAYLAQDPGRGNSRRGPRQDLPSRNGTSSHHHQDGTSRVRDLGPENGKDESARGRGRHQSRTGHPGRVQRPGVERQQSAAAFGSVQESRHRSQVDRQGVAHPHKASARRQGSLLSQEQKAL